MPRNRRSLASAARSREPGSDESGLSSGGSGLAEVGFGGAGKNRPGKIEPSAIAPGEHSSAWIGLEDIGVGRQEYPGER